MKSLGVLLLLASGDVAAATAYVTDELVLGVYAEQNGQGQRLSTLHSGATVETLGVNGEYTQVRLSDGTVGWVKSVYLTTHIPATVRIKPLEEELDRSRATTPALAEAAARSEVEQLRRELADKQSALDAALKSTPGADSNAIAGIPASGTAATRAGFLAGLPVRTGWRPWMVMPVVLAALVCGFWLGYATLARRIKHKFGGLKVY